MCTSEQVSAEKRLRLQPKAMDPEERRRHGNPGARRRWSPAPPGSLENEYLALLSDVNSYIMEGENLVLLIKYDTGSMFFAPAE